MLPLQQNALSLTDRINNVLIWSKSTKNLNSVIIYTLSLTCKLLFSIQWMKLNGDYDCKNNSILLLVHFEAWQSLVPCMADNSSDILLKISFCALQEKSITCLEGELMMTDFSLLVHFWKTLTRLWTNIFCLLVCLHCVPPSSALCICGCLKHKRVNKVSQGVFYSKTEVKLWTVAILQISDANLHCHFWLCSFRNLPEFLPRWPKSKQDQ